MRGGEEEGRGIMIEGRS